MFEALNISKFSLYVLNLKVPKGHGPLYVALKCFLNALCLYALTHTHPIAMLLQ